jgi:asparagine synthase (glutamine-hydrolysing)
LGVNAVLPNGQVIATRQGLRETWRRPLRFEPIDMELAEAGRQARTLLDAAVAKRARNAHQVGILLSSGMDSPPVAACAAALAARGEGPPVAAFTYHYPDVPETDETIGAQATAGFWQIPWAAVPIDPADVLVFPDSTFLVHDGPLYPGSCIWRRLAAAARDADVDVLLTGDGGDYWQLQPGLELELSWLRGDWIGGARWARHYARRSRRVAGKRVLRSMVKRLRGERAEAYFEGQTEGFWSRLGFETVEREAMRHGIRIEFPFSDLALASLLAGVPARIRSSPGLNKLVMREAMAGMLPETIRMQQRFVFADPVLQRAVGPYDGDHQISAEIARRYAETWRQLAVRGVIEPRGTDSARDG